jgi:hypothetical protein
MKEVTIKGVTYTQIAELDPILVKEFELIQEKKSKFTRTQRDKIECVFHLSYIVKLDKTTKGLFKGLCPISDIIAL